MTVDLSPDELTLVLRALDNYHSYLISQKREDPRYPALMERLRQLVSERKPARAEEAPRPRSRARRG